MLSWNPHFQATSWLNVEAQLGTTGMKSKIGNFFAARYQLGASFHNLFLDTFGGKDRLVPELYLGAETWAISAAGTYLAVSFNLHYRFHFENKGLFNIIDAVHGGFQWLPGSPGSAKQYTLGIRLVPFPEKRIDATPEPKVDKAPEPKPSEAPVTVAATPAPVVEDKAPEFKDIEKGQIAEIRPEGLSVTLPGSRISFETGKAVLDKTAKEFAKGFSNVLSQYQKDWDQIESVGHTDKRGNEKKNQKLSLARAQALVNEMKAAGIADLKLKSRGAGSKEPKDTADTEAAWKTNRRVVVKILSKNDLSTLAKAINEYDRNFSK